MIGSLDHIYLWTRDLDAAVAFSTDVVGLPVVRREGEGWAELDAGSIRFALHAGDDGTQTSGTVVFGMDDLEAARWTPDPEGNAVQIIEHTPAP
ncbi:MAG: VOC family protein [Actinomycetota bacterium]|nr:VOC family protein [Actinomycetota bacterium]